MFMARYNRENQNRRTRSEADRAILRLLRGARFARQAREGRRHGSVADGNGTPGVQSRPCALLNSLLASRLGPIVDCSSYLTRVSTLNQMSNPAVDEMMSSIAAIDMTGNWARALGVVITEIVHFVQSGVDAFDWVGIRLAVTQTDQQLLVGIEVSGGFSAVGSAEATDALLRASAIVKALGGDFQRGFIEGRMIIGCTFEDWHGPSSKASARSRGE